MVWGLAALRAVVRAVDSKGRIGLNSAAMAGGCRCRW